jgi:hypothetical protein
VAINIQKVREAAKANRIRWRYHSLLRASERGITRELALRVIDKGEILEEHPYAKPFPKCLMMATLESDRPLYVALGYDKEDYIYTITVHWLDPEKWEDPWTRRPKRSSGRRSKKP